MAPFKGYFIVFDGADFCGKGTQQELLCNYLYNHPLDKKKLISVVRTREPSNSLFTLEIRDFLEKGKSAREEGMRMSALYVNDRWQHILKTIVPNVEAGNIVVCDRYKYSTLCYQAAQGVPMADLLKMHEGMPVPDIVFFIDVPLEERLRRKASERNRAYAEVFEKENDFQLELDKNYAQLKSVLSDEPIYIVNGNRSKEEVFADVKSRVDRLLFQSGDL